VNEANKKEREEGVRPLAYPRHGCGMVFQGKMNVERARKTGYFTKRSFSKGLPSPVID